MSLVTTDEDIFLLPVFSSTPTNMISDCTLEWCTKYETAMYIYSLIILPFLTSINTVEMSLTLNLFQHKLFPLFHSKQHKMKVKPIRWIASTKVIYS